MILKLLVLLVAVTLIARRVFPRHPIPWAVPVVMALVIVGVRTVTWLTGDG